MRFGWTVKSSRCWTFASLLCLHLVEASLDQGAQETVDKKFESSADDHVQPASREEIPGRQKKHAHHVDGPPREAPGIDARDLCIAAELHLDALHLYVCMYVCLSVCLSECV